MTLFLERVKPASHKTLSFLHPCPSDAVHYLKGNHCFLVHLPETLYLHINILIFISLYIYFFHIYFFTHTHFNTNGRIWYNCCLSRAAKFIPGNHHPAITFTCALYTSLALPLLISTRNTEVSVFYLGQDLKFPTNMILFP